MTTNKHKLVAITADVSITAADGDTPDGPPKFEVVAYTGGPIQIVGWDKPVVIDLDGVTYSRSLIANLDHDKKQRVGHVTERITENGTLKLGGRASAATAARREVVESAAEGFVWQASIEAEPQKIDELAKGKTRRVNGRDVTGPAYVVASSVLKGFAFVSHGADDDTTVAISASVADSSLERAKTMKPELKTWIEAAGFDVDSLHDKQIELLAATHEEQLRTEKSKKKTRNLAEVIEAQKAENERVDRITAITAQAIYDNPYQIETIQALAETAVEARWDTDKYELELLRLLRPQAHPRGRGRNTAITNPKVLEAALCVTGGLANVEKRFDDQTLQLAHDMFPHGVGLQQLLLMAAAENGYDTKAHTVTLDVQRAAFRTDTQNTRVQAAGFSTLSLPNILSATANKFLLQGWMAVDNTWMSISSRRSVRNFQTVNSYSLTGGFDYEEVGPSGEIKHGTVGEETYTNKAATYGKMFAVTRTDIINDDLGALTQVPQRLGRGAALKLNNVFWTAFLNNSSFYTGGNNNVSTGAGSALGTAGLGAADVVFMNQTDPDGNPLGIMPQILLVPTTLKTTALQLMNAEALKGDTNEPNANVWRGRFDVYSSPYMENANYTGYSTAAWYLLADPSTLSTIEVCFLNGREAPVVETADAAFNVLGFEMRGYHDFGVSTQEYRGGVRSAGS